MGEVWQAPAFNLAGIALFENEGFQYIPTGDYEVVLLDTGLHKKKGETEPSSVIFRLRISEQGTEQGKAIAKWVGLVVNEGNARGWKSAYMTFGYKPEGLEGPVTPHSTHFKTGTKGYIHVESPPQAEGQKLEAKDIDVNFLSPETYKKRKAEKAMSGNGATAAGPQTSGFAPSSAAPSLPTAPPAAPSAPIAPAPAATSGASLFGSPPSAPGSAPGVGAPPPPPGA